ncbi:MAG: O-antigen ligase family protein [bacterium]|nr:O-antigen ligase family protein [bacterium]
MPTPKVVLRWIDKNLLLLLAGFLLGFIPLYPKLPLFDLIPGYLVRVRLEDIFILLTVIFWFIQLLRKKVTLRIPLAKIMGLYLVAGFLSLVSAVFITKTVPFELLHVGKSALHFLRYFEYFTLFFIVFSALKTKRDLKILLIVSFVTLFAVSAYGVGQRHLYWPVYSTMNREFSKGLRLYLTPHARVQSTFGGHYDLGGYLVLILPIVLATAYSLAKRRQRLALFSLFYFGIWLITVSASRTSFGSLILAVFVVLLFFALKEKSLLKKTTWFFQQAGILAICCGVILRLFGQDMYERLLQILESNTVAYSWYQNVDKHLESFVGDQMAKMPNILPQTMIEKPENGISTEEAAEMISVLVPSDARPSPERPSDVYVNVPDRKLVATTSAEGVTTMVLVEVERTYSQNALERGLSVAIRLDTLWPQAIAGFYKNPVLGSGYATLTKETVQQFTEAESTDNNYLRSLGETGLAGFITFYGCILTALTLSARTLRKKSSRKLSPYETAALIGVIAGTLGLLVNATYIDVFVASKIALLYWGYTGMAMAIYFWHKNET